MEKKSIKELKRSVSRFGFLWGTDILLNKGREFCSKITDRDISQSVENERKRQEQEIEIKAYTPGVLGEALVTARYLAAYTPMELFTAVPEFELGSIELYVITGKSEEVGVWEPEVYATYEEAKYAFDNYVDEYEADAKTDTLAKKGDYTVFYITKVKL